MLLIPLIADDHPPVVIFIFDVMKICSESGTFLLVKTHWYIGVHLSILNSCFNLFPFADISRITYNFIEYILSVLQIHVLNHSTVAYGTTFLLECIALLLSVPLMLNVVKLLEKI